MASIADPVTIDSIGSSFGAPRPDGWSVKDTVWSSSQQSDNNFARSVVAMRQGALETNVWEGRLQACQAAGTQQLATAHEGSATRAALAAQKDLDSRFQIIALQTALIDRSRPPCVSGGERRGHDHDAIPVFAPAAIAAGGVGLGVVL